MGRHTGPTERLSRREGVELELKGSRRLAGKGGPERRGGRPPGQHGHARERQLRNYVRAARRGAEGQHDERLVIALERRLDNVAYRRGLASTRAQARQFVGHGHFLINARRVDIPSYRVLPGDVIELRMGSGVRSAARGAADQLMTDLDGLRGTIARLPRREEIQAPVDEQLIVELYTSVLS